MENQLINILTRLNSQDTRRLGASLIFGDCLDYDPTDQLIVGLELFAMLEKLKKQWYAPCQTTIPQYYSQPALEPKAIVKSNLTCSAVGYETFFDLQDWAYNYHVADLTSISVIHEPTIGEVTISMNGLVYYECPKQQTDRTVLFGIGLKSHYSEQVVRFYFSLKLEKCQTCEMEAEINEVTCFTAQINEQ